MVFRRQKTVQAAEKYVSKGKIEHAIKEYLKVLDHNPNDANTLNRVGDLYARIDRIDEAIRLFTQIAEQYTDDGFFVKAIAIYKKIVKLAPTTLQAYGKLAELYARQGLLNEARSSYQVLADHYEQQGNAASAINTYQRMSELEPDNPTFHLRLAELYTEQQLTDKAVASYKSLADILLVEGSVEEAVPVLQRLLEVAGLGDLERVRETVGGLYDEGHVEAASKLLDHAVAANPDVRQIGADLGLLDRDEPLGETGTDTAPGYDDLPAMDDLPDPAAGGLGGMPDLHEEPTGPVRTISAAEAAEAANAAEAVAAPVFHDLVIDLDDDDDAADDVSDAAAADEPDADLAQIFALDLDDDTESENLVRPPDDFQPLTERDTSIDDGVEIDLDDEEIDLDDFSAAEPLPDIDDAIEASEEMELAASPQLTQTGRHRVEDLIAEAEVFAKYGLKGKAAERLREILTLNPEHINGRRLLAELDIEDGRHEDVAAHAQRLGRAAAHDDEAAAAWTAIAATLRATGYQLDGATVTHAPDGTPMAASVPDLADAEPGEMIASMPDLAGAEPGEMVASVPDLAGVDHSETGSIDITPFAEAVAEAS
ncbi:MAG: tetratricopeptide repeat protein, partial [Acidobacteriota bacterium]